MQTRNQYFLPCTLNGPLKSICHSSSGHLALKNFQRLNSCWYPFCPFLARTLFIVSLESLTPWTQRTAFLMKSGRLQMPCCMRAVPHLNVVLSLRIESSTSCVTLAGFCFLVLSLKYSLPTCLARFSHLYTVCLVVSKSWAMRATAKPFLTSFPKAPLMSGDSLTPSPDKLLCIHQR